MWQRKWNSVNEIRSNVVLFHNYQTPTKSKNICKLPYFHTESSVMLEIRIVKIKWQPNFMCNTNKLNTKKNYIYSEAPISLNIIQMQSKLVWPLFNHFTVTHSSIFCKWVRKRKRYAHTNTHTHTDYVILCMKFRIFTVYVLLTSSCISLLACNQQQQQIRSLEQNRDEQH